MVIITMPMIMPIKMVFWAALSAFFLSFAPINCAITVVAPEPKPKVIPMRMKKYGNTYPRLAKAVPPIIRPKKAVSAIILIA